MVAQFVGTIYTFDAPAAGSPQVSQLIRNNLEALARTNLTNDPTVPNPAREGMARVYVDNTGKYFLQYFLLGQWRTVAQGIQTGIPVGSKQIFKFTTAVNPWTITHNDGTQPLIQVYDSSFRELQVVPPGGPLAPATVDK